MRIITCEFPNGEVRATICPDQGVGRSREPAIAPKALPLTLPPNSEPRPGFGGTPRQTRFGNNARRTLSRCSGVFDRDGIKPSEILFLTGTLPGGTRCAMDALACWSSYAVDLLKSRISKLGITSAYSMYVWEFQRRGALHLHYAIHVPDPGLRIVLLSRFKSIWSDIIDAICKQSGVNLWLAKDGRDWATKKEVLQADAQEVRVSVGSYLAKYLSKQSPYQTTADEFGIPFLPPVRWWGCSRPLLARMRQLSRKLTIERCSLFRIQSAKNSMLEILTYSANAVHTYYSKCRTAQVFLTYDQDNSTQIFDTIKQQLLGNRRRDRAGELAISGTSGGPVYQCDAGNEAIKAGNGQHDPGTKTTGGIGSGVENVPVQLGFLAWDSRSRKWGPPSPEEGRRSTLLNGDN